ncbi:DUF4232 domain-containing protein [Streptomyces sp. NPDC052114]|uniref:DUF4232 domain-containing protein n=1 Tax=unclassified Streptomyces TaxID=2593676 RepID=UPI00341F9DAD
MKHTRIAALAALGLAATLSLTACGGDDTTTDSSAKDTPSSSSSNSDAKTENGSGTDNSQAGNGTSGSGKDSKAGTDADHTSNPIERGQAQPRITTLKPGDAAVFNLAYDIDPSGNSLASPTNIEVTPPNETHSVTLDWPTTAGDIKGAYTDVQVYPTHTTN